MMGSHGAEPCPSKKDHLVPEGLKIHLLLECIQTVKNWCRPVADCEPQWGPHPQKGSLALTRASQPYHPPSEPARRGQVTQTGPPRLTDAELLEQLFQPFCGILLGGPGRPHRQRKPSPPPSPPKHLPRAECRNSL